MNTPIYGIPLGLLLGFGIPLILFIVYLILRAMREGREISFWPPRIGPKLANNYPAPPKMSKDSLKKQKNRLPTAQSEAVQPGEDRSKASQPRHLPDKNYSRLFGRKSELETILGVLRKPQGKRIVLISGLGGIGKTALASAVVEKRQKDKAYKVVLWETAKEEFLGGGKIQLIAPASLSFETILQNLAERLGQAAMIKEKPLEAKRMILHDLLETQPCLIVLDNLETVKDYELLVKNIATLATEISHVLITSRYQLVDQDDIYTISLEGLPENDAIAFIRQEAAERGLTSLANAQNSTIGLIAQATGGAPLAIKLVLGQLSRLSIEIVLKNLQEAQGNSENLYTFVYRTTWKLLSPEARKVLIAMPAFPTSAIRSAIQRVSTVEHPRLPAALSELVTVSLLEVSDDLSDSQKRYSLHPLTRNFLNTELMNKWN